MDLPASRSCAVHHHVDADDHSGQSRRQRACACLLASAAVLHDHGVSITRHKMYRILKRVLKANYGTARILIKDNFDPDSSESKSKRATFLRAYAQALRLQKAGKAVIVFYDEAYINTGHAAKMTWYLDKSKRRLGGKGKRLIVLHALTKDGPWCVETLMVTTLS